MELNKYGLFEMQQSLGEQHPKLAELDLSQPSDVYALVWATSMLASKTSAVHETSLTYSSTREDGISERMTFEWLKDEKGELNWLFSLSSDDGTLSPEWAGMAANLVNDSHQVEIDRLLGNDA